MKKQFLLVGHPNVGKTTVFNALTGSKEHVGNWAGVTVASTTAPVINHSVYLQDLPGIHDLTRYDDAALDESITLDALAQGDYEGIIHVVDARYLARDLYLTHQLLAWGQPMVIWLTFREEAEALGYRLDLKSFQAMVRCRVAYWDLAQAPQLWSDACLSMRASPKMASPKTLIGTQTILFDVEAADQRYAWIKQCLQSIQSRTQVLTCQTRTQRWDEWILHPFLSFPILCFVLYALFFVSIQIGGLLQVFLDPLWGALWVDGPMHALLKWPILQSLWYGVGRGLQTTLGFVPVMSLMYGGLILLETSGYMARATFIVDRGMRWFGLPGQSLVPMIMGFGCNVLGIMAARVLRTQRDRIMTIMMAPFMSCSARLVIYSLFVQTFFVHHGAWVVFSLYALGVVMAILTGLMLQHTVLKGPMAPLLLSLPDYQLPRVGYWGRETLRRVSRFLIRALRLIVPVCCLLSLMESYVQSGTWSSWLTLWASPMGLESHNGAAVVALFMGLWAKEVVLGTLNTLYGLADAPVWDAPVAWSHTMSHAWQEACGALADRWHALWHWGYGAGDAALSTMVARHFTSKASVLAYLVFILLYTPCVSTMAVMRQELGTRWMLLSLIWSLLLAYATAVLVYQCSRLAVEGGVACFWIAGMLFMLWGFVRCLRGVRDGFLA